MQSTDPIVIRPVTTDLLPDFLALFGPSGACYGCWCTYFQLPPRERDSASSDRKRDVIVGWMQIGPRADVPEWNNPRRASTPLPDRPADDPGVWAILCFFFARKSRGLGLSHRMVAEGIVFARANDARIVEAAPMDRASRSGSIGLYVGSTTVFEKAGFVEIARQKPGRPLMRLVL